MVQSIKKPIYPAHTTHRGFLGLHVLLLALAIILALAHLSSKERAETKNKDRSEQIDER